MVTLLGGRVSVYLGSSTSSSLILFSFVLFWVDETWTLSRVVIMLVEQTLFVCCFCRGASWLWRPCLFATFGDPSSRTCRSLELLFFPSPVVLPQMSLWVDVLLRREWLFQCEVLLLSLLNRLDDVVTQGWLGLACCCHRREYVYSQVFWFGWF